MIGFYLSPLDRTRVLYVDEKTEMQAVERT